MTFADDNSSIALSDSARDAVIQAIEAIHARAEDGLDGHNGLESFVRVIDFQTLGKGKGAAIVGTAGRF